MMSLDWRTIPGEEMIKNSTIKLNVVPTQDDCMVEMAVEMMGEIVKKNAVGRRTTFIVPVGPTDQYIKFSKMVNAMRVSLKNVWFFNMDEYLDNDLNFIPKEDPLSFRGQMDQFVYNVVDPELVMPEEQRWFPTRGREEEEWELIQSLGGIDMCLGGIGINGHIAFNEAARADDPITKEEFAKLPTRMLKLTDETKAVNCSYACQGELPRLPQYCMTIGMREILCAKKIRIMSDGKRAYLIRRAMLGPVCPQFPVSYLQEHPDAMLITTPEALEPLVPLYGYYSRDGETNAK